MSKATVEQLIGKLLIDAAFRNAVVADPANALAGYDLSDEERAALLAGLNAKSFDALAGELEVRLSKGGALVSQWPAF